MIPFFLKSDNDCIKGMLGSLLVSQKHASLTPVTKKKMVINNYMI